MLHLFPSADFSALFFPSLRQPRRREILVSHVSCQPGLCQSRTIFGFFGRGSGITQFPHKGTFAVQSSNVGIIPPPCLDRCAMVPRFNRYMRWLAL
jgi:hypothetical protein